MANDTLVRENASAILESEMEELIARELPDSNPRTVEYLARVFATAPLANLERIRWNWAGLQTEFAGEEDRTRVLGVKLRHSREMGDNCLVYCSFYREETDERSGRPGLELMGLGRSGYNAAGVYAAILGEDSAPLYPQLSRRFPAIIVRVGPAILRNYLGDLNPPQRIIFYTPRGEMIFRLRTSLG